MAAMKTLPCIVAFFVLVFASSVLAQPVSPILVAQKARYDALIHHNYEALDKLLASDLTYTSANGIWDTKQKWMDAIENGDIQYLQFRPLNIHVRNYGTWAIATGYTQLKVRAEGKVRTHKILSTEVYHLQDGRWILVAYQSTLAI